nr:unnamed protein product [Callosobruchus chinensis]
MVLSMDRWAGKVAIVTGASSGLGEAIAERLVERGMKVVGVARRKERLDELAKRTSGKKGKLYPIQGDVSKEEDILRVFKWTRENVGPLHVLVNNAGIMCQSGIQDGKAEDWLQTINVNVVGLCMATREALKDMTEHKIDGHIFNINSIVGHYVLGYPKIELYTASKYAVTALTESMRKQMAMQKLKIRFTSISPGMVETELNAAARSHPSLANAPILKSEDIADAVEYALSTPPHVQLVVSFFRCEMVLSMDRWAGKVALVTGASSGIGEAIAERLVERGMKVVGVARRKDRLDELAKRTSGKKGKFYPMQGDVSKEEDILRVFKWTRENVGPVDVLVNNAGVICQSGIQDGKTEDWLQTINVNVVGLCMATREALKDMTEHKIDGHIFNINSITGHYVLAFPRTEIYTASKHAVTALTESMRKQMAMQKLKIRFTVVGVARRKDRLEALAQRTSGKKGKFYPIQGDVAKEEDILNVFKWTRENLGPVHVLINNAGVSCDSGVQDGKTEDWLKTFNINVIGLCMATREALKDMTEHKIDGHIFNINSVAGHYTLGIPKLEIYTATKHSVTTLTESMRKQMAMQKLKIRFTLNTEQISILNDDTPMLKSEDIADAVEYALSTPQHVQVIKILLY